MRCELTVIFGPGRSLDMSGQAEPSPERCAAARRWLDAAWERLGCEPLRPSGKVLLVDKVLGVADAYGHDALLGDPQLAGELACHVALALERPRVTVDLPGMAVAY